MSDVEELARLIEECAGPKVSQEIARRVLNAGWRKPKNAYSAIEWEKMSPGERTAYVAGYDRARNEGADRYARAAINYLATQTSATDAAINGVAAAIRGD